MDDSAVDSDITQQVLDQDPEAELFLCCLAIEAFAQKIACSRFVRARDFSLELGHLSSIA